MITFILLLTFGMENYVSSNHDPNTMIEPSSWLRSGVTIERIDGINLVKFTKELHTRLEELLEKRKANLLTPGEEVEYTGISELERILTFVNAKLIASRDS